MHESVHMHIHCNTCSLYVCKDFKKEWQIFITTNRHIEIITFQRVVHIIHRLLKQSAQCSQLC